MESWIIAEDYAGLRAQALGLAEAAGLAPDIRTIHPRPPFCWFPARFWPAPLRGVRPGVLAKPWPDILFSCGGTAAAVMAAMAGDGRRLVAIQHPRMNPTNFDAVVVNAHDELTGPNVIITRTALHRVTPERLAAEATHWAPHFAHLPRPLVSVLLGGSNGRFRLDLAVAGQLAGQLAAMVRHDRVGLAITPSRRTDPAVTRLLTDALTPLGAYVWDGTGENPYFGMLALADAIVATEDSVSMVSEAAATSAPVLLSRLPGRSRRIGRFLDTLTATGRVRDFSGRLETWPTLPLNDTPAAAEELRRRLQL